MVALDTVSAREISEKLWDKKYPLYNANELQLLTPSDSHIQGIGTICFVLVH